MAQKRVWQNAEKGGKDNQLWNGFCMKINNILTCLRGHPLKDGLNISKKRFPLSVSYKTHWDRQFLR